MNDGTYWEWNKAVSIDLMHCPICKGKIPEGQIGRENNFVKQGYSAYCAVCDKDLLLDETLHNSEFEKSIL